MQSSQRVVQSINQSISPHLNCFQLHNELNSSHSCSSSFLLTALAVAKVNAWQHNIHTHTHTHENIYTHTHICCFFSSFSVCIHQLQHSNSQRRILSASPLQPHFCLWQASRCCCPRLCCRLTLASGMFNNLESGFSTFSR